MHTTCTFMTTNLHAAEWPALGTQYERKTILLDEEV